MQALPKSIMNFFNSTFIQCYIYLFLAALSLCCYTWALSSCGHGLLRAAASFVGIIDFRCTGFRSCSTWAPQLHLAGSSMHGLPWLQHRRSQALECAGYSNCGTWSLLLHSIWNLSGPWIEPVSSSSAGRILIHCAARKVQAIFI